MLGFIASIRPYLEAGYFVAGMLLVLGIVIAFRQLVLIKRDIRVRNERAAKEHAIHACSRYLEAYVEKCKVMDRDRDKNKIGAYEGEIGDFSSESIQKHDLPVSLMRMAILSTLPALNELEAISAYFTTGVADERTGFQIIGRSFCKTVQYSYDVISLCRSEPAHPYWHNIVKLYSIWRPRLSKAELEHTIQTVEKRISALGPDLEIDPVGK